MWIKATAPLLLVSFAVCATSWADAAQVAGGKSSSVSELLE